MFNGSALYRADRAWFSVNETGYLILNDRQPYEIHIDSPTRVCALAATDVNSITTRSRLMFFIRQELPKTAREASH